MVERIAELRQQGENAVAGATDTAALEDVRVRFLGRKAELPNLLRGVAQLAPEERGPVGRAANEARKALEAAVDARRAELERAELDARLAADAVDVTLPGTPVTPVGRLHIITAMRREGLVESSPGVDARTRTVALTAKGAELVPFLEAEWRATEAAYESLEAELPYALTQVVRDMAAALEQRGQTDQPGGDDQRLGHRGVADRVRVRDGAVRGEVDTDRLRVRGDLLGHRGDGEPRLEESGGLGALTRGDDDNHAFSLPIRAGSCGALRY